ncbi:MAG: hypothetical protein FD183_554 [Chitinophagaceae bacterium]|nr:MAG: hypothetical protein FD183_554 [Chitinophagaceae bacterium]
MRNKRLSLEMPALFTQTSMAPNSLTVSFTNNSQSAKIPALLFTAFTLTPNASICLANDAAFSALLSLT